MGEFFRSSASIESRLSMLAIKEDGMGAWLFQGNEKDKFPISDCLRHGYELSKEIQWNVGKDWMPARVGDRAFLWRTEGGKPSTGGVIAIGRITREPRQEPDEVPEMWYDPNEPGAADDSIWRTWIRLEELRVRPETGMLRRRDLKTDPELEDLCILQRWRGVTVCVVEPQHDQVLMRRWSAAR